MTDQLDIAERLRQNSEMLRDGFQKNLPKLWHSEPVKDAATDALEAAGEIERLRKELAKAHDVLEL